MSVAACLRPQGSQFDNQSLHPIEIPSFSESRIVFYHFPTRRPAGSKIVAQLCVPLLALATWMPGPGVDFVSASQTDSDLETIPQQTVPQETAPLETNAQVTVPQETVAQDTGMVAAIGTFAPQGVLCLVGGGSIPDAVRSAFAAAGRAGQADSRLIIIPTASADADSDPPESWTQPWAALGFGSVEVLHTRSRQEADAPEFVAALEQASAIWISGGDQSRLAEIYAGTATEAKIIQRLQQGCAVGGTSAGAAIASQVMISGGRAEPELKQGFDLLPWSIVDQHFSQRDRSARLANAVAQHPLRVGIGIDESTAVFFHDRTLTVTGSGSAHVFWGQSAHAPAANMELKAGRKTWDWTTLARTAIERHQAPFPSGERVLPTVTGGSLLIVGGGGMDRQMWKTFLAAAGGEQANIVVLPTASPATEMRSNEAAMLRRMGAKHVAVLGATDHATVTSPAFLQQLENATGIWFGGGRQWRFVDAYQGTGAVAAMRKCLERGGVIGGSSAGASIQGDLLIRGAPTGNQIMVQDGYRRGFAFLPGVGIDQHFSQRRRFGDLEKTILEFPSILGIGIDESTALWVTEQRARVIGKGAVYFYDAQKIRESSLELPREERPIRVSAQQSIHLHTLEISDDGDSQP